MDSLSTASITWTRHLAKPVIWPLRDGWSVGSTACAYCTLAALRQRKEHLFQFKPCTFASQANHWPRWNSEQLVCRYAVQKPQRPGPRKEVLDGPGIIWMLLLQVWPIKYAVRPSNTGDHWQQIMAHWKAKLWLKYTPLGRCWAGRDSDSNRALRSQFHLSLCHICQSTRLRALGQWAWHVLGLAI